MSGEPTEVERLLSALGVTWEGEPVSTAVERIITQARREGAAENRRETEWDVEATPCHPHDEKCGGPGGPCRNHGGTFPVEKNRREQAERDVDALRDVLLRALGGSWTPTSLARAVIASDWYAERIAQARRAGAAEAWEDGARSGHHSPLTWFALRQCNPFRGDA